MFGSLRFRLPAIFLLSIVLAGLVSTALAVRLFQDSTRQQTLKELHREAAGIANFYAQYAGRNDFSPGNLQRATGDRIFYVGLPVVFDFKIRLPALPPGVVDRQKLLNGRVKTFEFRPDNGGETYIAVGQPLKLGQQVFGTLVVAKPKALLHERLLTLLERLAAAFAIGLVLAGALAIYLSRRITEPVLALTRAADKVAGGNYDVELGRTRGGDEIGLLTRRFGEMAQKLGAAEQRERNFLMSVSHELRTPLTAIRGHVSALREGVVEDPELRELSLEVIAAETVRLERLVGDVLDLAKLDAHRFTVLAEEVDMERLCEQAYAAFREEARRRGIAYKQEVQARPTVVTDGDRVLQIITNLLSNAFRWTPDGGVVELALSQENGSVSVAVGDTGPGIALGDRERIFRPFWSRDDGSGTGLGLAIAKELAGALGGRIELTTTEGLGSRFELVLPAK
ncbi:MAG: sensor histidine kinase [Gaiellaceae bacterium]